MAGNGNFGIDPEQVKAQEPKFAELSGDLTAGLSTLLNGLAAVGEAWGSDEFGQRFAANYVDKAGEAVTAVVGAVQLFDFLGKGVGLTGTTLENADQEFKDALTKLTGTLDGEA